MKASRKGKKVTVDTKGKPPFPGSDLDEGGTPSTIPTTRPISCEEKLGTAGASALTFSKKQDLAWLESAGSKQGKKSFLEKTGKRRIAFDQLNQDVLARRKQVSPFLRNSLLDLRSSFKGEPQASLKRLSSFEGNHKPASNQQLPPRDLKRQSLGAISKDKPRNSLFDKQPKVKSLCFPFQIDSGVKRIKPSLPSKRHQKTAASKGLKDFSSSKLETLLVSEKEREVFQLAENLRKIPAIGRSEQVKSAAACCGSADRPQTVDSYYRLVMDLDSLGKQPLSASLSTFIGNMSRKMMDFYNRFPIGTELPDRKVQLPKRDPKSSPGLTQKSTRSCSIWTRRWSGPRSRFRLLEASRGCCRATRAASQRCRTG